MGSLVSRSRTNEGRVAGPPVKYFGMCKDVLDTYRDEICAEQHIWRWKFKNLVDNFKGGRRVTWWQGDGILSASWDKDAPVVELDYLSPIQKFGYIRDYVAPHAQVIESRISHYNPPQVLAKLDQLKVLALGGGPATDLFAIVCLMGPRHHFTSTTMKVEYLSIDKVDWEPVYSRHIKPVLDKQNLPVEIDAHFDVADICAHAHANAPYPFNEEVAQFVCTTDILTFGWVVSEILKRSEEETANAALYFAKLLELAKPGCLLLFLDIPSGNARSESKEVQWIETLIESVKSKATFRGPGPMHQNGYCLTSERKKIMGSHFSETFPLHESIQYDVWILWKDNNEDQWLS